MDWRHRAACTEHDPELFFPHGTTGPALDQLLLAKAVCSGCPVAADCLRWALSSGQDAGVWGGLDEHERRRLRAAPRSPRIPAMPSAPALTDLLHQPMRRG